MRRSADVFAFLLGAAAVVGLGFEDGGFYPRAWQWGSLVALTIVMTVVVTQRRLALSNEEWWMVAALAGVASWIAVTAAARDHATLAVPELERSVLYIAVLATALVL